MFSSLPPFIILCGFMGSGKTTLGTQLAALLNRPFYDTDAEIEKISDQSVSSLFDAGGEEQFRLLETAVIKRIMSKDEKAVISLGGGTLMDEGNLQTVLDRGFLVYIQVPVGILAQRLENESAERPLLRGFKGEALQQRIDLLFSERQEAYEKAHLMVSGITLSADQLALILESQ